MTTKMVFERVKAEVIHANWMIKEYKKGGCNEGVNNVRQEFLTKISGMADIAELEDINILIIIKDSNIEYLKVFKIVCGKKKEIVEEYF